MFIKENPIVPSKTTCCICEFLLDTEACGEHQRWCNFIVEMEYLFKGAFTVKRNQKNGYKKYL